MAINAVFYENTVPQGTGVLAIQGDEGETDLFVPLRSTSVAGSFHGPVGSLVVTQTFRFSATAMDHPIEAVYRFPLPGDAAVTGVVATFGDDTVRTRLATKETAEQEYDDAFKNGRRAVLVTRESPDVFTLHLTGIPPDTEVVVATTVTVLARAVRKGWELRLPVTIGPRYVRNDEDHAGVQANPLLSAVDPGYRVSLDLRLLPTAGVIASPAGATVERTADGTLVRLADAMPDRDFVVGWGSAAEGWLTAWAADDEGKEFTYLLGLVTPKGEAAAPRVPREVIIVADQSGSMSGSKWEAAAASIRAFLDGLGTDELFNLCLFSDRAVWFGPGGPVPATRDAVAAAETFLERTRLFDGTEIGVALEQALRQPQRKGTYSRHVLVITDGEVTDEPRLLRLVETAAAPRRVSVIGIDTAPNSYLALEMARLGGGVAKFLTELDDTAGEIGTVLRDLLASWQPPVRLDAVLAADRAGLEAADYRVVDGPGGVAADIGDLRPETPVYVVARVPFSPAAPVVSVATRAGEAIATASTQSGGPALAAALGVVFGASRIRALEHLAFAGYGGDEVHRRLGELGYALPGDGGALYPENQHEAFRSRLEELIVAESLRFGVPSTRTAFVGVSATAGEAPRVTVAVPNALPAAWDHGRFRPGALYSVAAPVSMRYAASAPRGAGAGRSLHDLRSGGPLCDSADLLVFDTWDGETRRVPPGPPAPQTPVPASFDLDTLAEETRASAGAPAPKTRRWEIRSFDSAHDIAPLFHPFRIRKGWYVLVVAIPEDAAPAGVSITVRLDGVEIARWNAGEGGEHHQVVVPFDVRGAGRLQALVLDPHREWHRRPLTVFVRKGWD